MKQIAMLAACLLVWGGCQQDGSNSGQPGTASETGVYGGSSSDQAYPSSGGTPDTENAARRQMEQDQLDLNRNRETIPAESTNAFPSVTSPTSSEEELTTPSGENPSSSSEVLRDQQESGATDASTSDGPENSSASDNKPETSQDQQ